MWQMKRRTFLKLAAATTAAVALAPRLASAKLQFPEHPQGYTIEAPDEVKTEHLNSLCLMCHGRCGIRVKVKDGVVVKIDGNPYHPSSYDYVAKGEYVTKDDLKPDPEGFDLGSVCPKGAAGIAQLYSPARLLHPLKRAGKRGERKWKRISWEQAMKEIVEGGNLFGEGHVDGLRAIRDDAPIDASDSDYLDEAPPDGYGPKRNRFVWGRGRDESKQVWKRFTAAYGTINHFSHYDVCEMTRQVIRGMMNNGGHHADFKPDFKAATYILSVGSGVFDADFTAQTIARYLSKWFLRRPGVKAVHVAPRLSKGGGRMHEWLPIKPGTDVFFFMGMIRVLMEENLDKKDYLSRPNEEVAKEGGYINWTDATHLVSTTEPKIKIKTKNSKGEEDYTVEVDGKIVAASDAKKPANLFASTANAKTVYLMLKERAMEMTMDQYNDACGLPRGTIERITREWANSERPAINAYKGPSQQCNGSYNEIAHNSVLQLMGIIGTKGGMAGGASAGHGGLQLKGKGKTKPVDVSNLNTGVMVCRGSSEYAGKKSTSTKMWYPIAPGRGDGVSRELGTALLTGYPYKAKAVMFVMWNLVYTNFHAQNVEKALLNGKPPLAIGVNYDMNETDMLCDYVFPSNSYLETWADPGFPGVTHLAISGIRQPVIGNVEKDGKEYRGAFPDIMATDDFFIKLAIKLGLPNFGKGGGLHGEDVMDMKDFWDQHFNSGVFKGGIDRKAEHWAIGGRFKNPADLYTEDGKYMKAAYKGLLNFYPHHHSKDIASYKNSMTGKYHEGIPKLRESLFDAKEEPLKFDEKEYPYRMITYKSWHHTQSRTAINLWLMSIQPENALEINPVDAAKLGVKTGDWVLVEGISRDAQLRMKVELTERIRPGAVAVSQSYGHWEAGSRNYEVDGVMTTHADNRMGAGFQMNRLAPAEPSYPGDPSDNPCTGDVIGGSQHEYNIPVKITKL